MHELSLVQHAIEQALAAAQPARARRIERLTFAIASDSHMTSETVRTLVAALGRGTLLQDASVEVHRAPSLHPELTLVSIDVEADRTCAW